jgi:hypothetical protein
VKPRGGEEFHELSLDVDEPGRREFAVPRDELPAEEWLTIKSIVRELKLAERDWAADLMAGYFCQSEAPWKR